MGKKGGERGREEQPGTENREMKTDKDERAVEKVCTTHSVLYTPLECGWSTAAVFETEGTVADWGVTGRVWCRGLGPVLEHQWRGACGGV